MAEFDVNKIHSEPVTPEERAAALEKAAEAERIKKVQRRIQHDQQRRDDPNVGKWGVPFGKGGGRHRKNP